MTGRGIDVNVAVEQARYIKGKIVYQKDPEAPFGTLKNAGLLDFTCQMK